MYKTSIKILIFSVIMLFNLSCDKIWGDYPLGNNLYSMGGDAKEDRIIVYCTDKDWGRCISGIPVVPTYQRQFDSLGNYAEFVEEATSNKNWVIVRTLHLKDKKENYWIISKNFNIKGFDCTKVNCDSILQRHVTGPLDSVDFEIKKKKLNISLSFK